MPAGLENVMTNIVLPADNSACLRQHASRATGPDNVGPHRANIFNGS